MFSKTADLDGPVHYRDFGGEGGALVCVHGLGGSALNWMAVAPALARRHRVLAPDLRGFGRTPPGRGARLTDNLELVDRFLREVAGAPAILVGNSMGGLLAVMQAIRHPDTVKRLLLVDPALPWRRRRRVDREMSALFGFLLLPWLAERQLRRRGRLWGAERTVAAVLAITCADPSRVPPEVVAAHVELERERLAAGGGERALVQAARSLLWLLEVRPGLARMYGQVEAPVLLVQGDRDRLVPVEVSQAIARRHGWRIAVLEGVGHVPMLEAPDSFLGATLEWLEAQGECRA